MLMLAAPLQDTLTSSEKTAGAPQDQKLEDYMPLVRKIVLSIHRTLPPHIELCDLMSIGSMGLLEAQRNYSPEEGRFFEAYATLRIRGAILDELRRQDPLPRTARAKARVWDTAHEEMTQKLGRAPSDSEMRERLGMKPKQYRRLIRSIKSAKFISLDAEMVNDTDNTSCGLHEAIADDTLTTAAYAIEREEKSEALHLAFKVLPERQKKLLALLYFENIRLTEVAKLFGVTEARICQLRNQAFNHLRRELRNSETVDLN